MSTDTPTDLLGTGARAQYVEMQAGLRALV